MKNILLLFILTLITSTGFAEDVQLVTGSHKSDRHMKRLGNFEVSKGDQINLNIAVDHKRRGIDFQIYQYPGKVCVMDLSDIHSGSYTITAAADAIYSCSYGKEKCDVAISLSKATDKPNGPERGKIQFIRKSDTLHVGKYVNKLVGTNFDLIPYKEKVAVSTSIVPEKVVQRDFFTGVDRIDLPIHGDKKDPYRTQKLLSLNFSLIVQTPMMYSVMTDVTKAAISEFTPGWTDFCKALPGGRGKNNGTDMGKFVEPEELSKMEEASNALIEVGKEISAEELQGTSFENIAYLSDPAGASQLVLNKGLEQAGAPKEISNIVNSVYEIPSTDELLSAGLDKIMPQVKGKAYLDLYYRVNQECQTVAFPDKEFMIQSAREYGKSNKGYIYTSGDDNKGENGLNIKIKEGIDNNDRKWRIKPAINQTGYHNIVSILPSDKSYVLDNSGGESKMMNNGNNVHLWEKHNGKCQAFYFEHLGNGKFKIRNHDGFVLCLEGASSDNGRNIHIWEPHSGDQTEFYLLDPVTRQKFVPTSAQLAKKKMSRHFRVLSEKGGAILKEYKIAERTDALDLDKDIIDLTILVNKVTAESPAKLIVEAKYMVTDYTDVVKFNKINRDQYCKDFQTAYKVYYDYDIVFSDMRKDHHVTISENEFYSKNRAASERQNMDNLARLNRFDKLNQSASSQASK